ncbi:MAG: NAD(P)-binding domain-containing protein [Chloroflexi bacterium]|nr:NAD(P)-binding domain-containing protein [Chloroflexota bacterium]
MRIAAIGSGSVGTGLAKAWSALGHTVVIGSRSPESERVAALVSGIGNGVTAAGLASSVADADVIVLAVPWGAAEASITAIGDLSNRVIIDATNPFARGLKLDIGHTTSGGEQVAEWAAGARVVKALNIVDARLLDGRKLDGRQISIPICGDDVEAKKIATELIAELGFDVVDSGVLENSRLLEPLALLMIRLSMKKSLGAEIGFRVSRD